jgi:hypothetical protein
MKFAFYDLQHWLWGIRPEHRGHAGVVPESIFPSDLNAGCNAWVLRAKCAPPCCGHRAGAQGVAEALG